MSTYLHLGYPLFGQMSGINAIGICLASHPKAVEEMKTNLSFSG